MINSAPVTSEPSSSKGHLRNGVRLLATRWQARAFVVLGWLAIAGGGLAVVKDFMGSLSNTLPGPVGSPSRLARDAFDADFPGATPVMLTVLVTSADGVTPLIYSNESFGKSVDTPITAAASNASHELREMSLGISAQCNVSFASFWDLGPRVDPSENATEAAMLALADHALAFAAKGRLFNADATATLLVASVSACGGTPVTMRCASDPNGYCAPIAQLSQRLKGYAARANGQATGLRLQVVDFGDINDAIKTGIDQTMALSTLSMPLALAVLGFMLRNVRLLLVPLLCILCTLAAAVLTMYPVSRAMTVSGQAPSLMVASALAMSIDYSLFLLSRFAEEVHAGHGAARAVEIMLVTSGHTVAVSGGTLVLCFLGMLLMPVHTIQTMGLAAAITVVYAASQVERAVELVPQPASLASWGRLEPCSPGPPGRRDTLGKSRRAA